MLEEAPPRKGFIEPQQYQALSAALPDYLRVPLASGYFCGMRLGEVVNLKWEAAGLLG
jgi:integrase